MCWGNNSRLEIGSFANTIRFNDAEDGDSYSHYTPVPVVVEGFASGVSLLGQRCAVRVGQVACWGQNNASELDFDNDDKYLRLRPREAVIAGMDGKVQALLGLHYLYQPSLLSLTCGLVDGAARCWESELGSAPNDGPGPYTLQSFTSPELQKNVVAMGDTCAMVLYDSSIGVFGVWCWGRFELSDGKFEAGVGVPDERFTDTYDVSFEMPWLAFCYSEGAFYRPVGPYGVQECGAPPAN